jgi:hypothetical protein
MVKIRRQRPIRGGRTPLPACVIKDIYAAVDRLARRHSVSRSFVIAVTLADALGIDEQERYTAGERKEIQR